MAWTCPFPRVVLALTTGAPSILKPATRTKPLTTKLQIPKTRSKKLDVSARTLPCFPYSLAYIVSFPSRSSQTRPKEARHHSSHEQCHRRGP